MLARYLKSQLLVLLCGGLVGPIFLVVYFALGQLGLLQWMLYVGLLVTVADVIIAIGLANFGAKSAAKTAELEQYGVLALAQITGLTRRALGSTSNRWSRWTCTFPDLGLCRSTVKTG